MGLLDRIGQYVRKLAGKPPKDMEYVDYIAHYDWRNLGDVPRHELEAMCLYRRYVVMSQFKSMLEAILGSQYRIADRMESIYADALDVYERTGRQYLVGHIAFRGYYCMSWTSVNGGPLVRCPECNKLVQHETFKGGRHDCEDANEWGTIDQDLAEHTKDLRDVYERLSADVGVLNEKLKSIENLGAHRS